jgi:hypothetical protein
VAGLAFFHPTFAIATNSINWLPYSYREFCIQVEIPIFKGKAEETHRLVLKTRQTEDLKLCSQTPKLQVQHQFTIKHL